MPQVFNARRTPRRAFLFFATKEHREPKERLFPVFFSSAEALAKADVILRGCANFKTVQEF
jgi:hypothetical protein